MGVDGSRWLPLKAEEATRTGNHFDVIFSNNVLEHIHDLDGTFRALREVLKPDGSMIHNTVNYTVPYEPHFRTPLVPLFPRMTEWFKPSLRHSEFWKGLNFVTTGRIRRLCRSLGLAVSFDHEILRCTLIRLDTDPEFARRQSLFLPVYRFLKLTRGIELMRFLPPAWITPMRFPVTHRPGAGGLARCSRSAR